MGLFYKLESKIIKHRIIKLWKERKITTNDVRYILAKLDAIKNKYIKD